MDKFCNLCGSREAFLVSLDSSQHHLILIDFIAANLSVRLIPSPQCTVCGKCIGALETFRQLKLSVQTFQAETARHPHNEPPFASEPQHTTRPSTLEFNPAILSAVSLAVADDPLSVVSIKTEIPDLPVITSSISLSEATTYTSTPYTSTTPCLVPNSSHLELDERIKQEPLESIESASSQDELQSQDNSQEVQCNEDQTDDMAFTSPGPDLQANKKGSTWNNMSMFTVECLQCCQSEKTVEDMKVHYATQHGEDRMPLPSERTAYCFQCTLCGRKFSHYFGARQHSKIHKHYLAGVSNEYDVQEEDVGDNDANDGEEEFADGGDANDETASQPVYGASEKVGISDKNGPCDSNSSEHYEENKDSKERVRRQIWRQQLLHAHYEHVKEDSVNNNVQDASARDCSVLSKHNLKIEPFEALRNTDAVETDILGSICCKLVPTRDKTLRLSVKEDEEELEELNETKAALLRALIKNENIYSLAGEENSEYDYDPPPLHPPPSSDIKSSDSKTNSRTDHFLGLGSPEGQDSLGDDPKPDDEPTIENNFQCNLCNVFFPTIETLGDHMKRHALQVLKKNFDEGMVTVGDIQCTYCPATVKVKGYRLHFDKKHSNVSTSSQPEHVAGSGALRCAFCREEFKRTVQFEAHARPCFINRLIMEQLERKALEGINLSKEELLEVEWKKDVKRNEPAPKRYVKRMMNGMDDSGDYECDRCKLKCGTRLKFDIHYSYHGASLMDYTPSFFCVECDTTFASVSNARNHLKKLHMTENRNWLFCRHCLQSYETHKELANHMTEADEREEDEASPESSSENGQASQLEKAKNGGSVNRQRRKKQATLLKQLMINSNFTPAVLERRPRRKEHESGFYENLTRDTARSNQRDAVGNLSNQRDAHARSSSAESMSSTRTSRSNRSALLTPREQSPEAEKTLAQRLQEELQGKDKAKSTPRDEKKSKDRPKPTSETSGFFYYDKTGYPRKTHTCHHCSMRFITESVFNEHVKGCKSGHWKPSKTGGSCVICKIYCADLSNHNAMHGNLAHRLKTEKKYIYVYQCPLCMMDMKSSIGTFNAHVKQCKERGRAELRCKFCFKSCSNAGQRTTHMKKCSKELAGQKMRKAKTPLLKCTYCCRHVFISRDAHDAICKEPLEKLAVRDPDKKTSQKQQPPTEKSHVASNTPSSKDGQTATLQEVPTPKTPSTQLSTPNAAHSPSNKCKNCGKTFGLKIAYNKHMLKCPTVSSSQTSPSPNQACANPSQTSPSPNQACANPSQISPSPNQACANPSQTSSNPNQACVSPSKDNTTALKAVTCFICPFVPKDARPSSLYQHYALIHKLNIESSGHKNSRMYTCVYCKKPCKNFVTFNLHGHYHEKQKRANEARRQAQGDVGPPKKTKPGPLSMKTRERSQAANTSSESPLPTHSSPAEEVVTFTTRSGAVRAVEIINKQPSAPVSSGDEKSPTKHSKRLSENARITNSYKSRKAKMKRTKCECCGEFISNSNYTKHSVLCRQEREKREAWKPKLAAKRHCKHCNQLYPLNLFVTHALKCEMKSSYRSKSENTKVRKSMDPPGAAVKPDIVLKSASQLLKSTALTILQGKPSGKPSTPGSPGVVTVSAKSSPTLMSKPNIALTKLLLQSVKHLSKTTALSPSPAISHLKNKYCSLIEVISLDEDETCTIPIQHRAQSLGSSKELTVIKLPPKTPEQPKSGNKRPLATASVGSEEPNRKMQKKSPVVNRVEAPVVNRVEIQPVKKTVDCPLCFEQFHKRSCANHYTYYHMKDVNALSNYVELLGLKAEVNKLDLHRGIFCPTCEKTFTRPAMAMHYKKHNHGTRLERKEAIKLLGFRNEHDFLDFLENKPIPKPLSSVEVIDLIDTNSPPSSSILPRKKTSDTLPVARTPSAIETSAASANKNLEYYHILSRDRRLRNLSEPAKESPLEERRSKRSRERKNYNENIEVEDAEDAIDEDLSLADLMALKGMKRTRSDAQEKNKRRKTVLEVSTPILLNEDDADYLSEHSLEDPLADPFGGCADPEVPDKTPTRSDDEGLLPDVSDIPTVTDWDSLEKKNEQVAVEAAASKREIEQKHQLAKNIQSQISERIQAVLDKKKKEEDARKKKEEVERAKKREEERKKKEEEERMKKREEERKKKLEEERKKKLEEERRKHAEKMAQKKAVNVPLSKPPANIPPVPKPAIISKSSAHKPDLVKQSTPKSSQSQTSVKTLSTTAKTKTIVVTPKSNNASSSSPKIGPKSSKSTSSGKEVLSNEKNSPSHRGKELFRYSQPAQPTLKLKNVSPGEARSKDDTPNQPVQQKNIAPSAESPKQSAEKTEKLKHKLLLKFQKDKSQEKYQVSSKPRSPKPATDQRPEHNITQKLRDVKLPKRHAEEVARNNALLSKVQSISRENQSLEDKTPEKSAPPPTLPTPMSTSRNGVSDNIHLPAPSVTEHRPKINDPMSSKPQIESTHASSTAKTTSSEPNNASACASQPHSNTLQPTATAPSKVPLSGSVELFPPPPFHLVGFAETSRPVSPQTKPTASTVRDNFAVRSPDSPSTLPSLAKTVGVATLTNPTTVHSDLSAKTLTISPGLSSPRQSVITAPSSHASPWNTDAAASVPALVEYSKPSSYPSQSSASQPSTSVSESPNPRAAAMSSTAVSYPDKPIGQTYTSTSGQSSQRTTKLPPVSSFGFKNAASPYPFSNSPNALSDAHSPDAKNAYPSSPYGSTLTDNLLSIPIVPQRQLSETRSPSISTSYTPPVSKAQRSPSYAPLSTAYPLASTPGSAAQTPSSNLYPVSPTARVSSSNSVSYPVSSTPQIPSVNPVSYPISTTPRTVSSNPTGYPVSSNVTYPTSRSSPNMYAVNSTQSNLISYPINTPSYSSYYPSGGAYAAPSSHFENSPSYLYPPPPKPLLPIGEGFRPYQTSLVYDYPAPTYAGGYVPRGPHGSYPAPQYLPPGAPPPPGYYNPPHPDSY